MAYDSTLMSELVAEVRSRTDTNTPTPAVDFVKDTELQLWITTAYKEFIDYIASLGDAPLELLAKSADLAPGDPMPADFYRVVGVDVPDPSDQDRWVTLKQMAWRNRNGFLSYDRKYPRYRIVAGLLTLYPAQNDVTTFRLWYIPNTVSADEDPAFVTFHGWRNYIVATAAIAVCVKSESDTSEFVALKATSAGQIAAACAGLNSGDTTTIADVERYYEDAYDFWGV